MTLLQDIIKAGKVIPVLAFSSVEEAISVCRCLYEENVRVFEITLRHPTAIDQIKAVNNDLPNDAYVGVGTILNVSLLKDAMATGACFGVSPGLTPALAKAVIDAKWAFLPGIATLSEAMKAQEYGFKMLKFFPANVSGGAGFLKAAQAVLRDVQFCPTGGVSPDNARDYLALDNTPVVGGSWMIVKDKSGQVDIKETRIKARALQTI